MAYRLGVDLGTTYTAAATDVTGTPTMLGLGTRALQIPSVVFVKPDGEFLVGEAAETEGRAAPDRVVREFKRRLGDHVPILVGGAAYSPESLTARLLAWVVAAATTQIGEPPSEVVLTHPAGWGPYKLELLDQVVAIAGLPGARTIPEPVAAAAQYASRERVAVGERIVVYDLGGGTFDVCVLEQTDDGFRLLGTPQGVDNLGGIDFDEALFQHVFQALGDATISLDPDHPDTLLGLARLRRSCVEAKEELSDDVEAVVPVALPGLTTSVHVQRAEFEAAIRPMLTETVAATARALRSAGTEPGDLRSVVLVGGSARIPLVAELVQTELGVPATYDVHPKHDVVLGALAPTGRADALTEELPAVPSPTPEPVPARASDPGSAGGPVGPEAQPPGPWQTVAAAGPAPPTDDSDLLGRIATADSLDDSTTGDRATSTRTKLLIGAIAGVVVLAATAYALFGMLTGPIAGPRSNTPPPSTPSPSQPSALLTEDSMMSVEMATLLDPKRTWTAAPVASAPPTGPSQPACLAEPPADRPQAEQSQLRQLTSSGEDAPVALHQAEAFATVEEAQEAFAITERTLGGCLMPATYIESARRISGVGDESAGVVLRETIGSDDLVHSVIASRSGRVLNVVEVTRPEERISMTTTAGSVAAVINVQCEAAGGACAVGYDVEGAPPPASGDEPGLLVVADLPPIGDAPYGWLANPPTVPDDLELVGTDCETVDLADEGAESLTARTYLPDGGGTTVGLDQQVVVMPNARAAIRVAKDIRADWDSCPQRLAGIKVPEPKEVAGFGTNRVAIAGWTAVVTQEDGDGRTRVRVGVVTVGSKLVFTRLTPRKGFDFSELEFTRVALRAGERASQIP